MDRCETMLAIIFIENHDCKRCFGTHLALRNGAQKLCKKGTSGFRRGTSAPSQRGVLGFAGGTFAQFAKRWGAMASVAPAAPTSL